MLKFWFVLFVSAHDGGAGIGAPSLVVGPFQDVKACYGAAALGIDRLNSQNEGKDFRAACILDTDILPLQELARKAQ